MALEVMGLVQVVEKALVIREKKEKYIAREKEALLLCKHPMVVRLFSTFQVLFSTGVL
jgi:hypothetical protein